MQSPRQTNLSSRLSSGARTQPAAFFSVIATLFTAMSMLACSVLYAASPGEPSPGIPVVPASHRCDALGDAGWRVVATREIAQVVDGPPRHDRLSGDWWVDRQITVLPFCNYYNKVGNYSLRSYSLSPETVTQSVRICQGNNALAPYDGKCPPQ